SRVGNPARIRGVAYPGTVVLQATVDVIGIGAVNAHVVELRNRQISEVLPKIATILAAPQTAVIARDYGARIARIDPDIVKVAVCAAGNSAESFSAIGRKHQN